MSKFGKVMLVCSSIVATAGLLAFGYKKLTDSFKTLDFSDYI